MYRNPAEIPNRTRGAGLTRLLACLVVLACNPSTAPIPVHTVSAIVSGLAGTGLTLVENSGPPVIVSANGRVTFPARLAKGASYSIHVRHAPSNPPQSCTVVNGSGVIGDNDVADIVVTCITRTLTVSATVTGLAGTGLRISDGADTVSVTANGLVTFPSLVASGDSFAVVVIAQPASPAQVCVALGGTGIVGGSDVSGITINCDASSWTVGGTVTGLAGSGLVLQLNGANDLPVSASGSFSFGATIAQGHPYQVTTLTQPTNPAQTCTITNGSGTIPRPTGFDVIVSCSTTGATVGGFVYVANDSTNDISVFTYDPATGALTVVPGARAGTGTRPVALAVHPTGRFLYAASGTSRDLRAYNIDPATGALTAVAGGIFTLNGTYAPQSIVIDPAGRHAYVTANTPVDLDDNISSEIMIFAIDPATGVLSQLGGSLFNRHLPSNDAAITPDGKSLYYAKGYGPQGLVALAVDGATGALTPIAGYPLAGASVHALTVDPGGHFLYATNSTDETEEVRAYAIDTTGAVTFSSSSSAGVFPRELRFSPDGRIALVVDWMSAGRLSAYGINAATGALNPLSSIPAGGSPGALGVAPSGKYVYLTNLYRNTVSGFTLDPATGALSSVPGVFFATGHRPAAIAVVSK